MYRFAIPIVLLLFCGIGLFALDIPMDQTAFAVDIRLVLRSVAWLAGFLLGARLLVMGVRERFRRRSGHLPPKLLTDVIQGTFWSLGFAAFAVVELGVTPGTAFATSGLVIAVIGFAVRSLVADLFYGITMAIERPFEIGNWIQLNDGIVGRVEEMTWRAVKLVTKENLRVVVPNTQLASEHIVNYDQPEPFWRKAMQVTLGYEVTPAQVQRMLEASVSQVPISAAVGRSPESRIAGYSERGVDWELRFWLPDYPSSSEVYQQLQEAFLQYLRFSGVQIPRPREEIYIGALDQERDHDRRVVEDWIDQVPLFSVLAPGDRLALQSRAGSHRIPAGTEIVRQGEPGSSLYVLHEGALEVLIDSIHGGVEKVGAMGPGAVFGELSLLTGAARSATIRASMAALVHEITKADLEPLLREHPELAERLAEAVADRRVADSIRDSQRSESELQAERAGVVESLLAKARTFFRLGHAAGPTSRAVAAAGEPRQ